MNFLKSAIAASALALSLASPALAHDGVEIVDPYARFLPGGKSGAAFMIIENHSSTDERLISLTANVADRSELHSEKTNAAGLMQMPLIDGGIFIPGHESHALQRGGDHVMFLGLTRKVKDGDIVTLTLTFAHAGVVVVEVPVDNNR